MKNEQGFICPARSNQKKFGSDVELAELDATNERRPLVLVEDERRTTRVLGVADLDGAVGANLDGHAATLVHQRGELVALGLERVRTGLQIVHETLQVRPGKSTKPLT